MMRAGEGCVMRGQIPTLRAGPPSLLCFLAILLFISPAIAQRGGSGAPGHAENPPAPIPGPQESTFDQSHMVLDSSGKPIRQNRGDDRCLLPPLNGTLEPLVDVKSMQ